MQATTTSTGTGEEIILKGVSKTFPTAGGPLPVLRDIDLHIKAGEFVAFVGPSARRAAASPPCSTSSRGW